MRTRITTAFIQTILPLPLRRATAHYHSMTMKKVSIVYATKGGMGDAGKFAAAIAATDTNIDASIVSLSRDAIEGGTHGIADHEVDVTDGEIREKLAKDLIDVPIAHSDVDDEGGTTKVLESAFEGVDAVVACIGSREPFFGRWIAQGTELIIKAMKKRDVKRLVIMSSMGIGEDWIQFGLLKVIWGTMLLTVCRDAKRDLRAMEKLVGESNLDYLIVRPVGLTPEEPPKSKDEWKIVQTKDNIGFNIAKHDVGLFMLEQAINPTYSRTAVMLGSQPKN